MFLVPSAYAGLASIFIFGIVFFQNSVNRPDVTNNLAEQPIIEPVVPVDREVKPTVVLKPFNDESVKTIKTFYDYQAEEAKQEQAIVYFEKTYMQNKGMDFSSDKEFEVLAIMDGTVIEVKEDKLMGQIITIKHTSELISTYQSLSNIKVKKDDKVRAGQLIATSGTNAMNKESKNHLYFAIIYKDNFVNPENYFNKNIKEL